MLADVCRGKLTCRILLNRRRVIRGVIVPAVVLAAALWEGFAPAQPILEGALGPPAVARSRDTLALISGLRVTGDILSIDLFGMVRYTAPGVTGETSLPISLLERVEFAVPEQPAPAEDEVQVTSMDCIPGRVVSISAERIGLESAALGAISVARKSVDCIMFARARNGIELVGSHFDQGKLDPWQCTVGGWTAQGNFLISKTADGANSNLVMSLARESSVTIEVSVESVRAQNLRMSLILWSDIPDPDEHQATYLFANILSAEWLMWQYEKGVANRVMKGDFGGKSLQGGVFAFGYNPQTEEAALWLNGKQIGACKLPRVGMGGPHCLFYSREYVRVRSLRILSGFGPPSDALPMRHRETEELHLVRYANGQETLAAEVMLSDGILKATTVDGEVAKSADEAAQIILRGKRVPAAPLGDGEMRVDVNGSRLVVRRASMNADTLTGTNDILGPVTIQRAAVRSVQFRETPRDADRPAARMEGAGGGIVILHTVAPGDTLAAISQKYFGTATRWNEIAKENGIDPAKPILRPGQEIRIPLPAEP